MVISILTLALFGLIGYKILMLFTLRRHNFQEAASRGCLPPPMAPKKGFLGVGTLRESVIATREERGPIWMHEILNSVGKNIHTVKAAIFDYELIVTRDPENAKAIFAAQSEDFDIGPHREKCFKSLLGPGVMTNRQSQWKHSRGLIRPQFARDNIADLELFQRHLQALVDKMPADEDGWTSKLDLSPMFFNLTLDTSTEFLFGQSVHAQTPEKRAYLQMVWGQDGPDLANFGRHLDEAKHLIDRRGALAKYGWLIRDSKYPEHCEKVQSVVDYFVKQKLRQISDTEQSIETSSRNSSRFVLLDALAKKTRDPTELRSELLNVLHASRDTTAALLGWVFYFLARHSRVFDKVREEILATLSSDVGIEIQFSELWTCQYLQFVINETIRLVGIVPLNERAAMRDTTLPRGGGSDGQMPVFVPKGTQVLIPTYSMQHREDIWAPDVEKYKPERWQGRKIGWDFIPFAGGARQCLGRMFHILPGCELHDTDIEAEQFARTETMFVVARLLQLFDKLENLEGPGDIKMHHTIENRSGTGVQVRLHRAPSNYQSRCDLDNMYNLGLGAEHRESLA